MDSPPDVFVCHASDDKDSIARPIALRLRESGFHVWFDEFTLKLGDSLRGRIDAGLSSCRFGVVILSPRFFEKGWAKAELDALAAREFGDGRKVILPVWHEIDAEGIRARSPLLAGKIGVMTSRGLDAVVSSIVEVLRDAPPGTAPLPARASLSPADEAAYELEHQEAHDRAMGLLGGAIPRPWAFRHVEFRPGPYARTRFSLADLRAMAKSGSLDLKGWPILFFNPANSEQSYAAGGGLETFVKDGPRWHFWQLRQSGYLFARELLPDNRFGAPEGKRHYLDVERLGPDIAESVMALLGLYEGHLDRSAPVSLRFALLGVDGWHLGSSNPGRDFRKERYACRVKQVVAEQTRTLEEWRRSTLDAGIELYRTCCEMFNWETPDVGVAREKMDATISGKRRLG